MTKAELTVIMASVKSYVEGRLAQISERQGPAGERGERGERGEAGAAAPPVDTAAIVTEVLRQMPTPTNGADGKDGKDGRDGIDGKDGLPGRDGTDGDAGQRGEPGVQGERGLPGESIQGPQGERGERGEAVTGPPGKDAILPDLEPLIQRAFDSGFSKWAVDMERRAQDLFQRAIERMPVPKDGKDGFELQDLGVADDGHGNVTLTFTRGELSRSFSLRLPCFEYRGVFVEGQRYLSGHGVTFGGSFWIARKDDAQGKPGDQNSDWILAVKKGRDGRDGILKQPKPEGPVKL